MPAATNTMGMDTVTLPSRRGRSAVTKVAMLAARYSRPTGSNAIPPSSSRWRAGARLATSPACVLAGSGSDGSHPLGRSGATDTALTDVNASR